MCGIGLRPLARQLAPVKEVKKVDDSTIDFITDGPVPILPNYLVAAAIMSKAWCEAHNTTSAAVHEGLENYATRNANGQFSVAQEAFGVSFHNFLLGEGARLSISGAPRIPAAVRISATQGLNSVLADPVRTGRIVSDPAAMGQS